VARIRLDPGNLCDLSKGYFATNISEFQSYHVSQAVCSPRDAATLRPILHQLELSQQNDRDIAQSPRLRSDTESVIPATCLRGLFFRVSFSGARCCALLPCASAMSARWSGFTVACVNW
jgi:hypothetical protein